MPDVPQVDLPLSTCPRLVNFGIGRHGAYPEETYRLPGLWCLHLYGYRATLTVDGRTLPIAPGAASLVPPGAELTYRFRGRSEHVYAHFELRGGDTTPLPMMQSPPTFARLDAALREAVGYWPQGRLRAEVRLWDVLHHLADPPSADPADDAVGRLRAAIERNLSGDVGVETLLAELDLPYSHNHLLRLFKARTGHTIVGHLRERRCQRALGLLRHTSLPVKAVAAEVGVPDLHAFNKLIRARFGSPPTALRGGPAP